MMELDLSYLPTAITKNISIWDLSRYWRCYLIVLPLGGLAIVEKETIFDGTRTDFTRLVLVAAVKCF